MWLGRLYLATTAISAALSSLALSLTGRLGRGIDFMEVEVTILPLEIPIQAGVDEIWEGVGGR